MDAATAAIAVQTPRNSNTLVIQQFPISFRQQFHSNAGFSMHAKSDYLLAVF
tara:strand:- start:28479 stop:28634 length:156 start_codon:yes stop_codon:yes gene_type:complete